MLRTWARAMAEYIYIHGTFLLVKRGNYPQKAYLEHFCLWNKYALYNTSKKWECQKLCQTSVSGWGSLGEVIYANDHHHHHDDNDYHDIP